MQTGRCKPSATPVLSGTLGSMTGMAALGALTATIEMRHHLWITWTRIARKEVKQARAARQKVLEAKANGENWAAEMEPEYMAALVAVSACAHALDSIYGALKPLVSAIQVPKNASRHKHIRSVLAAAFTLGNPIEKHWKTEFTWLFDLRDGAVHYKEESLPTVPHPIAGHGSRAAAAYCMETADRALDLLLEVLTVLGKPDRARNDQVRSYSEDMSRIINDMLLARGSDRR